MHELLKYLRKSFDNRRGKRKEDICEQILGLNGKVNEFATFFEQHEDDILTIVAAALQRFETEREFSKEDMNIYRLGLTELPLFFSDCLKERNNKFKDEIERRQLLAQQAADGV